MIARVSPMANAEALTPSGAQIMPVANMSQSVPATWLGTAKNSLVPAFIGTRSGRNCQTSSSAIIVAVPSTVGSKRRHKPFRGAPASAAEVAASCTLAAWISAMA